MVSVPPAGLREVELAGTSFLVSDGPDSPHRAFWDLAAAGSWEPQAVEVVAAMAQAGATLVDIGAWIGPLSLLAAARGARVVAFEPDPVARRELEANLAANPELAGRVEVRAEALASWSGEARLLGGRHGLGRSLSRLAPDGDVAVACVDAAEVATWPGLGDASLIKIDIEGGEYRVVPRLGPWLRRSEPAVLVSLHSFDLRARAERAGRRVRRPVFRVVGARRRIPLLWALRHYPVVARATPDGWQPLGWGQRWLLAFRLDEAELYCTAGLPKRA